MGPFSQACENNRQPILEVIAPLLKAYDCVLEIGSGTGQHARFFADSMPWLTWHPSDLAINHPGIEAWREGYAGTNLPSPLTIDVTDSDWGLSLPGALFTANSLHIMPWSAVESLFVYLGKAAPKQHLLMVYGPFNYNGSYTSDSNARFDQWLAETHPGGGIRDFEAVDGLARQAGYQLLQDTEMPANNRLLAWRREDLVSPGWRRP